MSSSDVNLYRGDPPSAPPPWVPPAGPGAPGQPAAPYPPGPGYAPPGHGHPGYPPAGYGPPGYPPAYGRPTNTMAILALVLAFVFPPAGLVLGIVARRQIRQTGEDGEGLALAGIIVGGIATAILVLVFVFLIAAFTAATSYGY